MTFATIVLGAAALLLLMPVLVFVAQAIAAATRARPRSEPPSGTWRLVRASPC
jgi:hypothetical protein